jgi:hypothetical protein
MSSDFTVVHVLVVAGLIPLMLTSCSVEARPLVASIIVRDDASKPNALDYPAVILSENDSNLDQTGLRNSHDSTLKDPVDQNGLEDAEDQIDLKNLFGMKVEEQLLIESYQVEPSDSEHRVRQRRFRRGSRSSGNQQKRDSGEFGEFQNNISTTSNYYRHRNGWGGGYGK